MTTVVLIFGSLFLLAAALMCAGVAYQEIHKVAEKQEGADVRAATVGLYLTLICAGLAWLLAFAAGAQ